MHKARSTKTWFDEFGVEELQRSAQCPDLNLTEHVWDELERQFRDRPCHPTSVPDLLRRMEVLVAAKEAEEGGVWNGMSNKLI